MQSDTTDSFDYKPLIIFAVLLLAAIGTIVLFVTSKPKEIQVPTVTVLPTGVITPSAEVPEDFQNSLFWTLNFGTVNVRISRMGSGKIENTNWKKQFTRTLTNNETIASIYKGFPETYDGLVYDSGKMRYYDLGPSGYTQFRIATLAEFKSAAIPRTTKSTDKAAGVTIIHQQEPFQLGYTGGSIPWEAVKYSDYHILDGKNASDKTNWLSDGYRVVCYVPIDATDSFLEVDSPMHGAGDEINLCDQISAMGIQGASVVTMNGAEALEMVHSLVEVKQYLVRVPKGIVAIDSQDSAKFTVHVFEINDSGATATFNWYEVSKTNGTIAKMF